MAEEGDCTSDEQGVMTFEQAFDECLELWEILSEIPSFQFPKNYRVRLWDEELVWDSETIKSDILREVMSIEDYRSNSCPLCHFSSDECGSMDCERCPIGKGGTASHCWETSYREWEMVLKSTGRHSRSKAKEFYNYLVELRERWPGEETGSNSDG